MLQVKSLVPGSGVARSWLESLASDLAFNSHPRVLIEDPRRPAVSEAVLQSLLSLDAPAAAAARPVTDTYKEVTGQRVIRTVPRDTLVDAQGPWLFERMTLERAIAKVRRSGAACSSPVDLCRIAGVPVRLIPIEQ